MGDITKKNYLILWVTQKTTIYLCATYRVPMNINSDQGSYLIAVKFRNESESEVAQSCLTLCDPVDCSPPGSSVHGILQARSSGMGQYRWHTWAFPPALQCHCCWAMNRLLKQLLRWETHSQHMDASQENSSQCQGHVNPETVNTIQVQLLITEELLTTMSEWVSEVAQSCLTLCDPMDCSLPGSSLHGILQARILEWAAISFSRGSSRLGDRSRVPCIAGRCFNLWATREVQDNNSVLPLLQNLPPE